MTDYQFHVTELDIQKWESVLVLAYITFKGGISLVEKRIHTHERLIEYYAKLRPEDTYSYFLFLAYFAGDRPFEVWAIEPDSDDDSLLAVSDEYLGCLDLDIHEEKDPFDEFDQQFVDYTKTEEEINDVAEWTTLIRQGSLS